MEEQAVFGVVHHLLLPIGRRCFATAGQALSIGLETKVVGIGTERVRAQTSEGFDLEPGGWSCDFVFGEAQRFVRHVLGGVLVDGGRQDAARGGMRHCVELDERVLWEGSRWISWKRALVLLAGVCALFWQKL